MPFCVSILSCLSWFAKMLSLDAKFEAIAHIILLFSAVKRKNAVFGSCSTKKIAIHYSFFTSMVLQNQCFWGRLCARRGNATRYSNPIPKVSIVVTIPPRLHIYPRSQYLINTLDTFSPLSVCDCKNSFKGVVR